MSRVPCTTCEGGGCDDCALQHEEARGGDQGLSAAEIEVFHLRDQLRASEAARLKAEVAAAEFQRERDDARRERDGALESLAMFTGEVRA